MYKPFPYVDLEKHELRFSSKKVPLNINVKDKLNPKAVFIVAGTEKKIWDMYDEYPVKEAAQYAYKGETFKHWLNIMSHVYFVIDLYNTMKYKENIDPYNVIVWYIFSPKYGIIESHEKIENYNIEVPNIVVSEEQLLEQVKNLGIDKVKDVYFNFNFNFIDSRGYYTKLKDIFAKENIDLKLI